MFKRLITGSALQVISLFANILVAMVMMPFIIRHLGDIDYGLWVLVASFIGYYGLLDFGMSTAATRFISRADGRHDVNEMNVILNTASWFFAMLGLFIFAACVTTAGLVENSKTAWLWATVGITCLFQFGLRGFYGLYFARIRQDILSYTTLAKLTFRTAATVYYLNLGYGVVAVAVITMLSEVIFYLVDMYILRRIVPEMKVSWSLVKPKRVKEMINYGKFSMVVQIADLLKLRALPLIVTYSVGLAYVVFFSIAIRLMEIFHQVVEKVIHILTPVFSQYEGRGDMANIEKVFWMSFRINLILSLFIGGAMFLLSGNFINWWIGEEYTLAKDLTLWLTAGFIIFTMNETGKTALFGVSKHQKFAWISAVESAAAAMLGTALGMVYGAEAVAIGMVAVLGVVELAWKPYIIVRELGFSLEKYYTTMLEVGLKIGAPILLWVFFLREWYTTSIVYMTVVAVAYTLSLTAGMWYSLGEDTRGVLRRKIFSRLPLVGSKC